MPRGRKPKLKPQTKTESKPKKKFIPDPDNDPKVNPSGKSEFRKEKEELLVKGEGVEEVVVE